jgi:hypothetical protein
LMQAEMYLIKAVDTPHLSGAPSLTVLSSHTSLNSFCVVIPAKLRLNAHRTHYHHWDMVPCRHILSPNTMLVCRFLLKQTSPTSPDDTGRLVPSRTGIAYAVAIRIRSRSGAVDTHPHSGISSACCHRRSKQIRDLLYEVSCIMERLENRHNS